MVNRVNKFGLKVDTKLADFIDNEVLKDTDTKLTGWVLRY